ncbi:HAD family hydrolase [Mucilaginibacter myungsuensis]|uniref:phosphoglycolate phosphatase n=1 Tax=Mucilaginibacter myungsuensis TaxID=649104 RepID=A0A929KWJ4_9SPHI|nr:HAD family hydrolase [Mucilaginibacter myungsuensis]MBE9661765.1 HAD family hydrolase [Mucilaginibacter myungsuensis]MDN3599801.1 HAD family hydrolase [Mucilaginibacter myungsuensis]
MISTTPFDSIIFDLDGTLWDSTANVVVAWQRAKEQVDYIRRDITRDDVRSITGLAYDVIFETLFPYLDDDKRNEFKGICAKHELDVLYKLGGDLYPELASTLTYLQQKYRLFIVSNCQAGYIEVFLGKQGMDQYFEGHQCYGTKGQPKFRNILDVVSDYSLQNPVYIGDTNGDRDSAAKAGVPFIFASYGFGKDVTGGIATIDQVADLKNIL